MNFKNLENKKVFVSGGSGFLGRVIVEKLEEQGAIVSAPNRRQVNLIKFTDTYNYLVQNVPDMVIHSAAYYGGLGINYKEPGTIYFKNMMMQTNLIEICQRLKIKKFVGVGTGCAYPNGIERPMAEVDFWDGALHDSVVHYGGVKKMMQIQCEAYKKQWGFNGIHVVLTNLYGEWDSYSWERSHVVAALIRKFVEAKKFSKASVAVWGTGKPLREFLYVKDAAEGIIRAAKFYDDTLPLNICTGIPTTINELIDLIYTLTDYQGDVIYDTSQPDGQMVKYFDSTKMKNALEWEPPTLLRDGLIHTIAWFKNNYSKAIERW